MNDFNKRACEAWSEWLTDMHRREEKRRQFADGRQQKNSNTEIQSETAAAALNETNKGKEIYEPTNQMVRREDKHR